jgi:hypothetical protein
MESEEIYALSNTLYERQSIGNYGVALSVVCISSGLTSLFSYGLNTGGPVSENTTALVCCKSPIIDF